MVDPAEDNHQAPSRVWLTFKAPRKKASENVVCWSRLLQILPNITDELSIEANSVDPEQTAPIGAVWSGSTLFAIEAS